MRLVCQINKKLFPHILCNIILPLIIGLVIYLSVNKNTYISDYIKFPFTVNLIGITGIFVKCWLCDMLWSYALTQALYIALFSFPNRILFSAIISFVMGCILELLQLFSLVSGTFDILDILFELIAIVIAMGVLKRRTKI